MPTSAFRFIDLFAGVGGFHAALKAFGGGCVYAVEIDKHAAKVYEANWGHEALGDITKDADDDLGIMNVPEHDVLCAGFPCQPFSKSGAQRGMDETRGTLFFNIASIIKAHHPKIVLLENVRNLIGPRHEHEWDVIIETLRDEGYHVSEDAAIFSPHLLPSAMGGAPQVRERVFITATHAPRQVARDEELGGPSPVASMADRFPKTPTLDYVWDEQERQRLDWEWFEPRGHSSGWNLEDLLDDSHNIPGCDLSDAERRWIDAWDEFVQIMRPLMGDRHLPGHPIWADAWLDFKELKRINWRAKTIKVPTRVSRPTIDPSLPAWKQSHLRKNHDMFARHFEAIIPWAHYWGIYTDTFPPSRRKLEWQAQETKSLWDTVMHLRPSGIRAKKPTYLPALVAITQTSIVGPRERRLSPRETARLQGLPDTFVFTGQPAAATYRQMGNGVNVGAVWHVFREHVRRDEELLRKSATGRAIVKAVRAAPLRPNEILAEHVPARS
ncbi:MAG: DNA cytosine methyltransferase [Intrasporangium sp.]|uniref:DNA cytosine methyltransferase n=1 Tax=Intrasporangium sp. TaxID=1925024 RepID=UPI002647A429|nr:DNA cytosine methyltransferase [Intrasporangium sp.]MDN5797891.1 DNA cytosine methyltransferase [Intrasporangium sp.]